MSDTPISDSRPSTWFVIESLRFSIWPSPIARQNVSLIVALYTHTTYRIISTIKRIHVGMKLMHRSYPMTANIHAQKGHNAYQSPWLCGTSSRSASPETWESRTSPPVDSPRRLCKSQRIYPRSTWYACRRGPANRVVSNPVVRIIQRPHCSWDYQDWYDKQ